MARYQSVDALQNLLAEEIFHQSVSPKKAAGRALGTLVELVTFYMIRDWGLETSLAIERGLPEYGNAEITHNVEFSLHPASVTTSVPIIDRTKTLTPTQILAAARSAGLQVGQKRGNAALLKGNVLRHATVFAEAEGGFWVAHMVGDSADMEITRLKTKPYAMVECKRVGVEQGMKKGPQTIEKAKQGAYVARTVSGLQRVPRSDGSVAAVVEDQKGKLQHYESYYDFLRNAIDQGDVNALANIVLTIGVVSNHGNWFTAETKNKEMRVLAQSYDWLLFFTDDGLAEFIEDVLNGDQDELKATRAAFRANVGRAKGEPTVFTKVQIEAEADRELTEYFAREQPWDRWFNVIAPAPSDVATAREAEADDSLNMLEKAGRYVALAELKKDLHTLKVLHEQEAEQ